MNTSVEGDGPVQLLMPPGRDHHGVATTHGRLHDELPLANGPIVEQRPHQPVDRVAAEILRHRQDLATALRRVDDAVAASHRQRQRFLTERVQAELEELRGDAVVRTRISRAGGSLQPLEFGHHRRRAGKHRRPLPEHLLRFVGQVRGIAFVRIADSDEIDRLKSTPASSVIPARCRRPIPPHRRSPDAAEGDGVSGC